MTLKPACVTRWPAPALIAGLFLTGCATASFECGSVKEYAPEIQSAAADELQALPANSVIAMFIADYGIMRAETRACQQARSGL